MSTKWYWSEETQTVEFYQEKLIRRKKLSLGEIRRKRALQRLILQRDKINNEPSDPKKNTESSVTLSMIEDVSMRLLASVITIKRDFITLIESRLFPAFLLASLHYFDCFFRKLHWEASLDQSLIDKSEKEKEEIKKLNQKLKKAEKIMGHCYLPIILGKGFEPLHHMQSGRVKYSSTSKDKFLFESLHSYVCYAVWVANRRMGFEIIQNEIGRLLKTNVFNPHTVERKQIKGEKITQLSKETKEMLPKSSKFTASHIPKSSHNANVIKMNSPALSSALFSHLNEMENVSDGRSEDIYEMLVSRYGVDLRNLSCGILGMPLHMFNVMTLTEKRVDDEVLVPNTDEILGVGEEEKINN